VEFYVYNSEFDSYKTIKSTDNTNDSKDELFKGRFFLNKNRDYTIEFKDKGKDENSRAQFEIKNEKGLMTPLVNTSWTMDLFENSLALEVTSSDTTSDNPWIKGMKFKNYWPLLKNNNLDVLELFLEAQYFDMDCFKFDISADTIKIKSMKGTFVK